MIIDIEELSTKIDDLTPIIVYKNLIKIYKGINRYIFKKSKVNKNDIVKKICLTCTYQKISIAIYL